MRVKRKHDLAIFDTAAHVIGHCRKVIRSSSQRTSEREGPFIRVSSRSRRTNVPGGIDRPIDDDARLLRPKNIERLDVDVVALASNRRGAGVRFPECPEAITETVDTTVWQPA